MNLIKSTIVSIEPEGEFIVVRIIYYNGDKPTTDKYPTNEYSLQDIVNKYKSNT